MYFNSTYICVVMVPSVYSDLCIVIEGMVSGENSIGMQRLDYVKTVEEDVGSNKSSNMKSSRQE